MDMGLSDRQIDYTDEVELTNRRIVTELQMTTTIRKDKNNT